METLLNGIGCDKDRPAFAVAEGGDDLLRGSDHFPFQLRCNSNRGVFRPDQPSVGYIQDPQAILEAER